MKIGADQTTDQQGVVERLKACYTGAVYDVLRKMGHPNQALPVSIRPLTDESKLAGRVFTVSGHTVPNLDPHQSLLQWTAMLSRAEAGSVVICQPNDSSVAHMGELSAETFHRRGILGYIVDGGCRDTNFIVKLGFPVFCRYTTPVDVVGRWLAEAFNEPICIGGVLIRGGDYVLGDRDGIVVIPSEVLLDVLRKTEEVMQTESKVRTAILGGEDPQQAYLKYGKF
jgi:4-hydroxy-4-methyl-2-oxoglutarate aldolase